MKFGKIYIASIFLLLTFLVITSCNGGAERLEGTKTQYKSIEDIPDAEWQKLATKKIYFAHQSVGQNIIDGIVELMAAKPRIQLNIQETKDLAAIKGGVFAHSRIEGNKSECFKQIVEKDFANHVDIAFFKYCFVDILEDTDIHKVFDQYKSAMQQLEKENPRVQFLHFTVPITFHQTGMDAFVANAKGMIKKVTGQFDYNKFFDNRKRDELNEMLRKEYGDKMGFFDIAKIQSTRSDGTREAFSKGQNTYFAMATEYTNDGGHLNDKGRRLIAEQLLLVLVNLP